MEIGHENRTDDGTMDTIGSGLGDTSVSVAETPGFSNHPRLSIETDSASESSRGGFFSRGRTAFAGIPSQGRRAVTGIGSHVSRHPWLDAGLVAAVFFTLGYVFGKRGGSRTSFTTDASRPYERSAADDLTLSHSY